MGIALKRYPAIPGPEWTRKIWASQAAHDLWAPRLPAIGQAWQAVERASVGRFRQAARQSIAPDQFPEFSRKAALHGLTAVALRQEAAGGSYQAGPAIATGGGPWAFQAALCATPAAARAFLAAWDRGDDQVIGELLGFPPCCIEFFRRVWVDEKWIDTTWPMAVASLRTLQGPGSLALGDGEFATRHDGMPIEANILLRWLGVRWVPHLPCSFDCPGTVALGRAFGDLMGGSFAQEAAWINELLDSPIEWSAWRGIAEIKHPLFKISTKTDATAQRLVVQRAGGRYPQAGATGNAFPYRPVSTAEAPLVFHRPNPTSWSDNGFTSEAAMVGAHRLIREVFQSCVKAAPDARVLDLGCGNGALVASLTSRPEGVEADRARAERARANCDVFPGSIADFITINDWGRYDCVLLMPGRILEMSASDATALHAWLKAHADRVLVYAYGDWLQRYDDPKSGLAGLQALCRAAGLTLDPTMPACRIGGVDAEAGVLA